MCLCLCLCLCLCDAYAYQVRGWYTAYLTACARACVRAGRIKTHGEEPKKDEPKKVEDDGDSEVSAREKGRA